MDFMSQKKALLLIETLNISSVDWVIGFSFGCWVTYQLLRSFSPSKGIIWIAPSTHEGMMNTIDWPSKRFIIQGRDDQLCPFSQNHAFSVKNEFEFIAFSSETQGVIKYKNKIISLPTTEIISHNSFFDYDAKYNGESDEITPADITKEEEEEVRKISLDIYKKLNLKGFSRCDFILRNNLFYFLEVNTNPGLTEESILPQQAIAANISLKDLFRSVIDKYE